MEMLQLAGFVASCLIAYNQRTEGKVNQADIFKDVASSISATYRVNLRPTFIKAQAQQIAAPSEAQE